ncbi:MAG TPA: exopolysaccharide biosynthesis protein [Chromatiales bacterium]|nr:exopolysaccharide biosynthesis protein [Chromatiales bacterium]
MDRVEKLSQTRLKKQVATDTEETNISFQGSVAGINHIDYRQTRTVQLSKSWLRENRIICDYQQDSHLNAYKFLRTKVLRALNEHNWNTLGITSPGPEVGKTVTAINLAINIAMEISKTVLLVDADLRRPTVHRYLGLPAGAGLSECLSFGDPLSELLIHPDIGEVVVLPGGQPVLNSSEMLGSPQMANLVEELKNRYPSRLVLFDLPPVLVVDDVLAFAPCLDAVLMVAEAGKTKKDELMDACAMLEGATHVIGTVLNKTDPDVQSYPYY